MPPKASPALGPVLKFLLSRRDARCSLNEGEEVPKDWLSPWHGVVCSRKSVERLSLGLVWGSEITMLSDHSSVLAKLDVELNVSVQTPELPNCLWPPLQWTGLLPEPSCSPLPILFLMSLQEQDKKMLLWFFIHCNHYLCQLGLPQQNAKD